MTLTLEKLQKFKASLKSMNLDPNKEFYIIKKRKGWVKRRNRTSGITI